MSEQTLDFLIDENYRLHNEVKEKEREILALKRKICGLEQTIANYKEKQEKFFRGI